MQKTNYALIYFGIIVLSLLYMYYFFMPINIKDISYELINNKIYAHVNLSGNTNSSYCITNTNSVEVLNHKCSIMLEDDNTLIIKNRFNSKSYNLYPEIDKVIDFSTTYTKTYIVKNEVKDINIDKIKTIGNPSYKINVKSSDENIVKVLDNNKIKGISDGEVTLEILIEDIKKEIKVISTTLITKPKFETNKKKLSCNKFSESEGKLLDNLLEFRVKEAGYKTRAAAVAAARFLTLEFPYRVPYFYENGRVHKSGVHFVDGEGRYYKKGLYLTKSKFDSIKSSWTGPATWGCPLRNLEDEPRWGYTVGKMVGNGLDCSGFVSWVMVQAGFNPGDIGAGENPGEYQLTDLGKFTKITDDIIKSNTIKVGDLFNYWGHISILIAMDKDYFYIAESLPNFDGVVANKYKKSEVSNTFPYVVFMDQYYKEDGNYTEFYK